MKCTITTTDISKPKEAGAEGATMSACSCGSWVNAFKGLWTFGDLFCDFPDHGDNTSAGIQLLGVIRQRGLGA
jgi:hypothetical protein